MTICRPDDIGQTHDDATLVQFHLLRAELHKRARDAAELAALWRTAADVMQGVVDRLRDGSVRPSALGLPAAMYADLAHLFRDTLPY